MEATATSTATSPAARSSRNPPTSTEAAGGPLRLDVGDGHTIFVETYGRRDGVPAVFLHGGPGSGCQPSHRSLFDPARFFAVFIDQRGAGRSTPHGKREANTTAHLIADMERVRETLGIERWMLVGGSWGATLAIAYAEKHPERVSGIVLRATFLGTRAELDWAFVHGPRTFHPRLFAEFSGLVPEAERGDLLGAYWRRILDADPMVHRPVALAWHDVERVYSVLAPPLTVLDPAPGVDRKMPATPFMEAHYFSQDCFLRPGQLLAEAGRLRDIPGILVQGQYDMLCPPTTAHALAAAWGTARVVTVPNAGHSLSEPGVSEAVARAVAGLAAE